MSVEIDKDAVSTLRANRPNWHVFEGDVREIRGTDYVGIDLFAGGVPCPPFSVAGHQLGADDERDLFPEALRLIAESKPRAVLLENVKGLASARFADYRAAILSELTRLGYHADWQLVYSSEFGVPQLRPRFVLVAFLGSDEPFKWPAPVGSPSTVGEVLKSEMSANGWAGAEEWAKLADGIGPTIVGGSKKHGGADLGPTRAKAAWKRLAVDGRGIADSAPSKEAPVDHIPRLTNEMVARVQGFDKSWRFSGRKTSVYRQIGNAFPPPVAEGIGSNIRLALNANRTRDHSSLGGHVH
ncbi:MAG: modification methylase [Schumannella sp.]|nr:modification methylase [Schumannella sp.]